jgi:hypothetical protein
MGEFFRHWRRKTGFMTLLLACMLAGWWMHSLSLAPDTEGIRSYFVFHSVGIAFECDDFAHGVQLDGSHRSRSKTLSSLFVSYWQIVLPLTLIAAYLLLWKPRREKSKLL